MRSPAPPSIVAFGLLFAATAVLAAGDPVRGKDKVTICQACHGRDGNSVYNPQWERLTTQDLANQSEQARKFEADPVWAKLAGQDARYLAAQLIDFKTGKRRDPFMSKLAADLSDADIFDIAAYYAAQTPRPDTTDQEAGSVQRGEALYKTGNLAAGVPACIACHRRRAHGTPTLPRLAGQYTIYLRKQLWAFKSGERAGSVMNAIADKLSEADIDDVARYLAGLK